ncbi:MAG: hypothetical protein OXF28_00800 [Thaumarchaeota archaeon]|nr:hypothetical protein [Nitrososphaerota archaeon]MCY3975660.1 hypothetical protein [Nitrososphaerota archaeon]
MEINHYTKILNITEKQANAIKDPIRIEIIKILYNDELTTEQIFNKLTQNGFTKSLSVIRHHVNVLKNSQFIKLSKTKQIRGTVLKFYTSAVLIFNFDLPTNFILDYDPTINKISMKLEKIICGLLKKFNNKIKDEDKDYTKFIISEIINLSLLRSLEKV